MRHRIVQGHEGVINNMVLKRVASTVSYGQDWSIDLPLMIRANDIHRKVGVFRVGSDELESQVPSLASFNRRYI